MTKVQTSLVSLIAAIPGGLLAYGMVMSFLNFASQSPLSFRIISGVALVVAVLLALLPLAILAYGGPRTKEAKEPKTGSEALAVSAPQADVVEDYSQSGVQSIDDLEVAGETDENNLVSAETYEEFPIEEDAAVEEAVAEEIPADDDFDVNAMESYAGVPIEEMPADADQLETFEDFEIEEVPAEEEIVDFEELPEDEPPKKKKKK